MKERKYIKLRTDMYEDTKFKIIDMHPERDMIHYVWTRMLTLAGKVNMAGELYMSRNLPYTIETLAIEFNRSEEQVKLALDVFMELEMIEVTEDGVYRVKNFAKHQNIKVEEKTKNEDKIVNVKNIEASTKIAINNENYDEEEKKSNWEEVDTVVKNNGVKNQGDVIINHNRRCLESNSSEFEKENNLSRENGNNISQNNITIPFEKKKSKKTQAKKKKEEAINITDEDEEISCFREGEYILGEGEKIIASWAF